MNRPSSIIYRPSSACTLPNVHFVPLELCPFVSTFVENPLQIDYFLCKTNPIFLDFNKKTMITLKNKPNTNPIQTQFTRRPKMNANIYYEKIYNNKTTFCRKKTKPIQTQFHHRLLCLLTIVLNRPIMTPKTFERFYYGF
jgi:hypothetical protein